MNLNRRRFAQSLTGVFGAFAAGAAAAPAAAPRIASALARAPGITHRRPDGSLTHW